MSITNVLTLEMDDNPLTKKKFKITSNTRKRNTNAHLFF